MICYSEKVEQVQLSEQGTIYAYTIIRTRPPKDFTIPYAVGYVLLEHEQIVVPALFHYSKEQLDSIHIGQKVTVQENEDENHADYIFVALD